MTPEPHFTQPGVAVSAVDDRHAEVTLRGDIGLPLLCEVEELSADPRLLRAERWVLNLDGVPRIELACAYALLRAATEHSGTVTVRGARHSVLHTLRQAGLDKAAVIEKQHRRPPPAP
ncbi:STAS domain-containing protein [Streptomyces sp. NPDC048324]|uniref:STAS domain-containing protein n=1 Tax=Streptomyces sp. NPDC048324 TaxID=3157205 RepID=UPI00341941DD